MLRPEPKVPEFASAGAVFADALDALLPADRVYVDDYAAGHRWLANEGGGYVGRWSHSVAPYLVEPMRALTSDDHLTTCVVGPGQCGKTAIAENWMQATVATDPADMLWFMQTDAGVEAYVKGRINPMIDMHDDLHGRLGLRAVDDSLHFKRFRGMNVEFLSATNANLINKRAPRIVADELDAYAESLGDVKVLLDVRRQTYGSESMLLMLSHPDMARGLDPARDWTSGIMAVYADSDRRVWYWPCPQCNAWSSPVPLAQRHMALEYENTGTLDEVEASARLVCPCCGYPVQDHERRAMNARGVWIGEGQEIAEDGTVTGELVSRATAGFWIVGAMSPFVMGGIGALARARVKAERDLENAGDDTTRTTARQVMSKMWGIPYQPRGDAGSVDADTLADRAEPDFEKGRVPAGVRFLVAVADIQGDRFEWMIRGFGVGGESWVIDVGRIKADPATDPAAWDALIEHLMRPVPLCDGSGRAMAPRAVGFDSQGQPGVTEQAYGAWSRARKAHLVKRIGRIGGREAWTVIPLRGLSGINAPRLQVVYPDTSRLTGRKAGAMNVPQGQFNPNTFKVALLGQLGCAEPGPWYVHFPASFRSEVPPHGWFEQLVSEQETKPGRWEKKMPAARNEALDLMVMSHVVAHLHGVNRIDWARPPGWAAAWESNTSIVDLDPAIVPEPVSSPEAPITQAPAAPVVQKAGLSVKTERGARRSAAAHLAARLSR